MIIRFPDSSVVDTTQVAAIRYSDTSTGVLSVVSSAGSFDIHCASEAEAIEFLARIYDGIVANRATLDLNSDATVSIAGLSVASGTVRGWTRTVITGTGFRVTGFVKFGGNVALRTFFVSSTKLLAWSPAADAYGTGVVDVTYTDDRGVVTLTGGFTYV